MNHQEYYNLITKAKTFAQEKHKGISRTNGEPYYNHLERVSDNVPRYYEEAKIAALLHDTLEDTNTTYEELVAEFGEVIANIVKNVTRPKHESYFDFINRIVDTKDKNSIIVKLEDLRDNMSDSEEGSRLDKYRFAAVMLNQALLKL